MKILIDMNLTPAWVSYFAERQIESVHWSTVGNPKADDREIMDYARALLDRGALITLDPDKCRTRILPIIPGRKK